MFCVSDSTFRRALKPKLRLILQMSAAATDRRQNEGDVQDVLKRNGLQKGGRRDVHMCCPSRRHVGFSQTCPLRFTQYIDIKRGACASNRVEHKV
jgi:hypothetical protein